MKTIINLKEMITQKIFTNNLQNKEIQEDVVVSEAIVANENSEVCEVCDDSEYCYAKIYFSSCCCAAQMINVISQIIQYYPKDNLIVTLENGNAITGRPGSLFPNVDSGLFLLTDSNDRVQEAASICKIVSIAVTSAAYNEKITYKSIPEERPLGCDSNCESAIRQYLPVGSETQIKAGGQTVANGIVHINVYGMLVVVDKNNNNPVFVSTCKIESVK